MTLSHLAGQSNEHSRTTTVRFLRGDVCYVHQNFVLSCIISWIRSLFFRIRSCMASVALSGDARCVVRQSSTLLLAICPKCSDYRTYNMTQHVINNNINIPYTWHVLWNMRWWSSSWRSKMDEHCRRERHVHKKAILHTFIANYCMLVVSWPSTTVAYSSVFFISKAVKMSLIQ